MLAISILDFTLLDWLVLGIVLYSVVMSAMRGFVREVLGLITVVAAMFLAAWFYRDLGMLVSNVVRTETLLYSLGSPSCSGGRYWLASLDLVIYRFSSSRISNG